MKKDKKRLLSIMNCYIGALVGAGFASGQEILQFFVNFGYKGLWGVWLAGLMFAVLGAYILAYKYKSGTTTYDQLLAAVLGKTLGKLTDLLIALMLFGGLVIMLAGCQATLIQQFKMSYLPASVISLGLIFLTMSQGEKGVLQFNNILIPFLGVITVIVAVRAIMSGLENPITVYHTQFAFGSWLLAAFLYVSYNMVLGTVILSSLEISHPVEFWGGLLGGLGLGFLAFLISLALLFNLNFVIGEKVPMLALAGDVGLLKFFYGLVLLAAMLTTAVANLYALIKRLEKHLPLHPIMSVMLILLLANFLTPIGFTRLIASLYPSFGYLGFVLLGGLIISALQNAIKCAKYYLKL